MIPNIPLVSSRCTDDLDDADLQQGTLQFKLRPGAQLATSSGEEPVGPCQSVTKPDMAAPGLVPAEAWFGELCREATFPISP